MLLWQDKFAHPATINTINVTRNERRNDIRWSSAEWGEFLQSLGEMHQDQAYCWCKQHLDPHKVYDQSSRA